MLQKSQKFYEYKEILQNITGDFTNHRRFYKKLQGILRKIAGNVLKITGIFQIIQ